MFSLLPSVWEAELQLCDNERLSGGLNLKNLLQKKIFIFRREEVAETSLVERNSEYWSQAIMQGF